MKILSSEGLSYEQVYIVPQYSQITTRSQVDVSTQIGPIRLEIPLISANMDSVTSPEMAIGMWKAGAIGALHRFVPITENVSQFIYTRANGAECFVSIGVNGEAKERARALYEVGAKYFIIDIAHGHSEMMKSTLGWLKSTYPDVYIMAGNVATAEGAYDLHTWGADCIKAGISNGSVCLTRNTTGVGIPQFTAVCNAVEGLKSTGVPVVADGSVSEIGDVAKALGAGASLVMCGRLFASCREAPGERKDGKKNFRGMASREAMLTIRDKDNLPTPEGKSIWIDDSEESIEEIVQKVKGGLQSSFSYSNASSLIEFQRNVVFGIRH